MSASPKSLPLMGLGTFIGIEHDQIINPVERAKTVKQTILIALQQGYQHFDLAQSYGNLEAIGEAFKQAFKPIEDGGLGIKRCDLWITMKSDSYSQSTIESYIRTLGVDHLDTFMLHHPYNNSIFGSEEKLRQTWATVTSLPKELVRNYGVSNCYPAHIARLIAVCDKYELPYPFSNEVESNLYCPNEETIAICQQHDIQVIAYSPLGYNFATTILSGSEMMGANCLPTIAKELNATTAQTVLAWHMSRGIAVIPKSTNPDRIANNFDSSTFVKNITPKQIEQLSAMKLADWQGLTDTAVLASQHGQSLSWQIKPRDIVKLEPQISPKILQPLDIAKEETNSADRDELELLRLAFFNKHDAYKNSQSFQCFRYSGIDKSMSWPAIINHALGKSHKNTDLYFFSQYSGNRSITILKDMKILDNDGIIINDDLLKEHPSLKQEVADFLL